MLSAMRLQPLFGSRVAPVAALYGATMGLVAEWRVVADALGIGALTVVPVAFGWLIVREARRAARRGGKPGPGGLYTLFAPLYCSALAVGALILAGSDPVGAVLIGTSSPEADRAATEVWVKVGVWLFALGAVGGLIGHAGADGISAAVTLKRRRGNGEGDDPARE